MEKGVKARYLFEDEVVCPYCYYRQFVEVDEEEEEKTIKCDECGREMKVLLEWYLMAEPVE